MRNKKLLNNIITTS